MWVESIAIENFKSFDNSSPTITDFKKVNVFIGQNGSGKTNVIEALYFIKRLDNEENDPDYPNYVKDCAFDHQYDNNISLELILVTSDQERNELFKYFKTERHKLALLNNEFDFIKRIKYSIQVNDEKIVGETLAVSHSDGFVDILERILEDGNPIRYSIKLQEALSEINSLDQLNTLNLIRDDTIWQPSKKVLNLLTDDFEAKIAELIRSFYKQFHWYFAARVVNHKSEGILNFIFGDGRNIKDHIRHLNKYEHVNFLRLKEIANNYLGISDIQIDNTNDIKIKMSGLNSWFDLRSLSAGQVQLLILLEAMVILKSTNIYFIEEPEVHVHSYTQKRLLKLFKEKSNDSQFFITTHSPNFFSASEDVSIYSVTKNDGRSKVKLADTYEAFQSIKAELGIDNIDALKSNFVLFVEGQTEVIAFREMGKISMYSPLKFIPIVPYKTESQFDQLAEFTRYAHELGLVPLIIADGHRKVEEFDQLRVGWKIYKKIRKKDEQFEELFDSKILVKAMIIICNRYAYEFKMTEYELDIEREKTDESGKRTGVAKILNDASPVGLNKTELAKELVCIIKSEIEANSSDKPRKRQKFEDETDLVMNWLKM